MRLTNMQLNGGGSFGFGFGGIHDGVVGTIVVEDSIVDSSPGSAVRSLLFFFYAIIPFILSQNFFESESEDDTFRQAVPYVHSFHFFDAIVTLFYRVITTSLSLTVDNINFTLQNSLSRHIFSFCYN